jgi:glutathione S-transferase
MWHILIVVRFVLNYKKLSYKTVYLTFPEIPKEFKKKGIPCSGESAKGPLYTCPSIFDHSNNTPVTESFNIALYLDKTYPDTPKALPPGTEALQSAFHDRFFEVIGAILPFLLPKIPFVLHPDSSEPFSQDRERDFGKPLADIEPKGEERVKAWKEVKAAFDTLHGWLNKTPGPYFMGETVTFADFVVGGTLITLEITFGENSQEWKDITTWNNGEWVAFKKNLEKFADFDN